MPTPEMIDAILKLGMSGLLLIAVVAFAREWVVPGTVAKRREAERDAAYQRLDRFIDVVEAATGVRSAK